MPSPNTRRIIIGSAVIAILAGLIMTHGCARRIPSTFHVGLASWYGKKFHGKRTASGERYNMHAMTAAHNVLPFGTKVRVTNLRNNRSVVVRINDRGPFIEGRIIDLSYAAAKKLKCITEGVVMVRVEVLD